MDQASRCLKRAISRGAYNFSVLFMPEPNRLDKRGLSRCESEGDLCRKAANLRSHLVTFGSSMNLSAYPSPILTKSLALPVAASVTLRPDEFHDLEELGCGFGGVVYKSLHIPTGRLVARKVVNSRICSAKVRKSLAAELLTLQRCNHANIVRCYGAFVSDMQVSIAMEFMDGGSFDRIIRTMGPLPEEILSSVTKAVLHGLVYLHQGLNIIHRDLKPSNVLLNSQGQIKLCDFGESIELVNSTARSLVGTMGYMAPERIDGRPYDIRADVWSLGITLMELATGHFPYDLPPSQRQAMTPVSFSDYSATAETLPGENNKLAIIELWETIKIDPSPRLDPTRFTTDFTNFVNLCLIKDDRLRPDPYYLLLHPFLHRASSASALLGWSQKVINRNKR